MLDSRNQYDIESVQDASFHVCFEIRDLSIDDWIFTPWQPDR